MSVLGAGVVAASVFPRGGRRLVVYVVYDRRGGVEDFVVHALAGLREHAAHVVVVANGSLTDEGRAKLAPVADSVLVRDNRGYDIWAHKEALEFVGDLSSYDEVVLTNDTWFGPVRPYGPVFERMDARPVHFWGMTDHAEEVPNPFTGEGRLPYHLQSFWIAVRREMFLSEQWRRYWRELPEMPDYFDAVLKHEAVFTKQFADRGFVAEAAFPYRKYPTTHPALFNADLLIDDGCPLLKRRPLFHYPPFLDRHAVIGRWTLERVESYGFPMPLIWSNLARNVQPRVLNADAAMLEVLPDVDTSYDPTTPLRIVVIAHIFYVEMTDEILDRADTLPADYDLVVTTPEQDRADAIREIVSARSSAPRNVEIRVVRNEGRDQSAFLIGCRDILLGDRYDLVVKLHSKKTPQDGFNVGRYFKDQQFANLLNSPGYAANMVALFQREPGLGLAYPPTIHVGYPTMGRGWWSNKAGFERIAADLGILVPLDEISPLAPYGSMYFARPEALRLLIDHEWSYDDFGGAEAYQDGGLAHILERVPSYAAAELGFHTRTVASTEHLAISHTAFDFNLDQMSATMAGFTIDQIHFLKRAGYVGDGSLSDFVRMYRRMGYPGSSLLGVMSAARRRLVRFAGRARSALARTKR
ncbi:rhamnan synthesis F family protein [Microbacterium sp. SSM24]|uniref:rhamnan synthesis F family protein n=1 Tax=Microbacterium sp. SSM24 TaxID=2991714 RepID=UPI002225FE39|nr:rhamnan synthesis F family protein [Microbacterium sp. SSM24]MCW3493749.1 rhamnan synthesis F family protein [Microbacterium sp. SSM24]